MLNIICRQCVAASLKSNKVQFAARWLSLSAQNHQTPSESPDQSVDDASLPVKRTLPLLTSRKLKDVPFNASPRQAWLENMDTIECNKLGIVDLHPEVFSVFPRIDLLWGNVMWQRKYRTVDYRFLPDRHELPGGGRKPWPQKGTGRARHGSMRSPLWIRGAKTFGPRGPKSYFYMLPKSARIHGLTTALTVKLAQDNLHIVDSLELPSEDPQYLRELIESRGWGLSVLFVDDTDVVPKNIALATDEIQPYNIMPAYGLNVISMLKHETLVMSLAALEKIEHKLVTALHAPGPTNEKFDWANMNDNYAPPGIIKE